MDEDEGMELMLLGYILSDNDLWLTGERAIESEEILEPPRKKRCWVRPWIQKKETKDANTMYKLQLEISEVCTGQ